jgi:hypothetical protein
MVSISKVVLVGVLVLIVVGGLQLGALSVFASTPATSSKPVFVWMFGYTGDYFYPQTQLGISVAQTVNAAKRISSDVGGSGNLRLIGVVGQEPGQNIQSSNISTIAAYVSGLKPYASVLYGRLDMEEFNFTSSTTLISQVALYVNQLGLNGVWFDHGPNEWQAIGSAKFNTGMQQIVKEFPNLNIIVNQAVEKGGYITPESNDTWGANTWISPSLVSGTYNQVNLTTISALNAIYPNRVVLHFDANAQVSSEPMGLFANQAKGTEKSTVRNLVSDGKSNNFDLVFPVLGASTEASSVYNGTIYNSLKFGLYHRGTITSFIHQMNAIQK